MAGEKIWYVRLEDGKAYGPADVAALVSWAEDGRIGPTASVSQDRRSWESVLLMPELGMNWLVEVAPGEVFGPFNRKVVSDLVQKGSLSEATRIYRLYELPVDQDPPTIEKIVEKEVPVEVVKEVRVEVPVEKVVEKIVEKKVPVEVVKEVRVEVPVEKIVEKVVEKKVPVEVVKEVRVEVPVEKVVEKIVEKKVPVEVVKEVRVEVPVEKIVEKIVEVPMAPVEVVEPEVVVEPVRSQPAAAATHHDVRPPFGGAFGGRCNSLAALEAAARRELAAARRQKKGFGFFGGK